MHGRQSTQLPRRDLHVRDLKCHSEDEGKVNEVPVVRRIFTGKIESSINFRRPRDVV